MKTGVAIAGAILALTLLIAGGFAFRWVTADIRGEMDARETILADGDFRITAYNSFFNQCAAIQNHEGRIASLELELNDTENPPSESRAETIRMSLTAIRSQRTAAINNYNGDAAREWTSGQFRDEGLPYQIDDREESTGCSIE